LFKRAATMKDNEIHLLIDIHREILHDLRQEADGVVEKLAKQIDRNFSAIEESLNVLANKATFTKKERSIFHALREELAEFSDQKKSGSLKRLERIAEYFSNVRRLLKKSRSQDGD
jgi:predicted transcriptional regulator